MKKRTKQLIKRVTTGTLAVMLSVTLNFNPLATIAGAVVDSGIVDKFGILKDNLVYMARGGPDTVYADTGDSTPDDSGLNAVLDYLDSMAGWMSSDHDNLGDVLGELQSFHSDNTDENQRMKEVQDSINKNVKDGFSQIHTDIKVFQQSVETHFGIVEQQLSHISEQLDMINENIDSMQHNYRVAHLYSLNSEFETSLWRPYTSEVPYVSDFAQVIGQFANVYTGYWDTSITEMDRPGGSKAQRALEVLGYDAIVRYEGVILKDETLQSKPIENQTRDLRVSVLGDSISTFAEYTPEEYPDTYPAEDVEEVMQSWWAALIGSMGFQFAANASYSGCYVLPWEGENELTWAGNPDRINALRGADGSTPDVILVYLGINDLEGGLEGDRWALTNADMLGTEEGSFEDYYGEILHRVEATYPNAYVFCCTIQPRSEEDSEEVFMNDADLTYEDYNAVIRNVAIQYQCPIIDFGSAWSVEENMENTFDSVHPNLEGMTKMAEAGVAGIQSAGVLGRVGGVGQIKVMNQPKGQSGQHEGYDMAGNTVPTQLALLYQEFIPEKNITWLDAVTVLYKAIGQHLYTYQTFSTPNSLITPETSPAYAGFSNIVPDEQGFYNGYDFYMYLNRSNTVTGTANNYTMTAIYWQKALNEQFVTARTDMNSEITASEFYILASKMMQAYGEPVLNQDEIKALLQVYGSKYPVTLGFEVADAWAYLKVRGCLNMDLVPSDYLSRDDLLDICMCIADPDSRSDYKNIDIVLDIGSLLRDDGYYPAYDLDFSVGSFQVTDVYDYTKMSNFTYLIAKIDGYELGESGALRVYSQPDTTSEQVPNAAGSNTTIVVDDVEFYVVSVPVPSSVKTNTESSNWNGNFYIGMVSAETNTVVPEDISWIEVPASYAIGGFFVGGYTKSSSDVATVSVLDNARLPFDWQANNGDIVEFADYERMTGKDINIVGSSASNASLRESIAYKLNDWFEPMIVEAGAQRHDANSTTSLVQFSDDSLNTRKFSDLQWSVAGSLSDSISASTYLPYHGSTTINIAGNEYTMFLNRLWYASNTNGADTLLKEGFTIGQFAKKFYSRAGANVWDGGEPTSDGVLMFGQTLHDTIDSGGNITPNTMVSASANAGGTSHVNVSKQATLLAYAMGFNPVPTLYNNVTSGENYDFDSGINVPSSKMNDTIAGDINRLLESTKTIDDAVGSAVNLYGAKVTVTSSGYQIDSSNAKSVEDLLGSVVKSDVLNFEKNIASTAVMNRDLQILLSWEDMVNCGIAYSTQDGGQPKRSEDGCYYFMTNDGQVKVNDEKHTIQIGTTLYDLLYSGTKSPTLVYCDSEQYNTLYFDIRCVTGVMTNSFTRNDTKTEALRNVIGAGSYAVYDIDPRGVKSDLFTAVPVLCYNFPEVGESSFANNLPADKADYSVNTLTWTQFDGSPYTTGDNEQMTYWTESDTAGINSYSRFLLTSMVPTANWLMVIDDDGTNYNASLFVYYPKVVFEDDGGFVNEPGGTKSVVPEPKWNPDRWQDLGAKLSQASGIKNSSNTSVQTMLLEMYDVSNIDDAPWYVKMTIDAVVDLYLLTGKYYISPDFIVREFRVTANCITTVEAWDEYDGTVVDSFDRTAGSQLYDTEYIRYEDAANSVGAIYWLDGVGFVYNMPTIKDFTLEKYFTGEYPLPVAYDAESNYKPLAGIINYNMNYYGVGVKTGNIEGEEIPYGYVLSDAGYIHYKSGIESSDKPEVFPGYEVNVNVTSQSNSQNGIQSDLPLRGEDDGNGTLVYPFRMADNDLNNTRGLKLAPVGIYFTFGGNPIINTKVKSINAYNTKVNKFYYGSSRIALNSQQSQTSSAKFDFVSTLYNPIAINSEMQFYRVWQGRTSEAWIAQNPTIKEAYSDDVTEVHGDDWLPTELANWLDGLGSNDIITAIDEGSSWLILIAFWVLPIIGIILMTILVGLSFIGDNKVVQHITEKTFDPVKLLTFGGRDIYHWHWKKVLVPCILLYISFALFLNGNVIRIIMFLAEWYDAIITWSRSVF